MSEIEVGEYIRTEKGKIGKVIRMRMFDNSRYDRPHYLIEWSDNKVYFMSQVKNFKHSKNIIDIVEVGDYVNGYLVGGISDNGGTAEKEIMIEIPYEKTYNKHTLNEKIKTILTHEQYEQNCYKVVE